MRIAIIQSCYVPWRGFFDLIGRCDEYVIFDQVQYAKRHWHNRNRIKTAAGLEWLTIPVLSKGRYEQPIDEVEIEKPWAEKHWRALELAYRRAPFFRGARSDRAQLVRASGQGEAADRGQRPLHARNRKSAAGSALGSSATPPIRFEGTKTERLLGIARAAGADRYLSGPSAKAYLDEAVFAAAGIRVEWMSYEGYPDTLSCMATFEPAVSVLDLIFNVGPDAPRYLARRPADGAEQAALRRRARLFYGHSPAWSLDFSRVSNVVTTAKYCSRRRTSRG